MKKTKTEIALIWDAIHGILLRERNTDAKRLPTQTVTTEFENFEEAREYFQCNCSFMADREAA